MKKSTIKILSRQAISLAAGIVTGVAGGKVAAQATDSKPFGTLFGMVAGVQVATNLDEGLQAFDCFRPTEAEPADEEPEKDSKEA